MSSGIYKITDLRNNKIYIGRAVNLSNRLWRHKCFLQPNNYKKTSLESEIHMDIHQAMLESQNEKDFKFEIIEECAIDLLNEREQFYIKVFNCLIPNGYNKTPGGQTFSHAQGENHYNHKITQQEADQIKTFLQQGLTNKEIIQKIPVATIGIISTINSGRAWHDDTISYPITKMNGVISVSDETVIQLRKERANGVTVKELAKKYNIASNTISSITTGVTRQDVDGPITKGQERNQLTKEQVEFYRQYYANNNIQIKQLWEQAKKQDNIDLGYDGFKQMIEGHSYKNYAMFKRKNFIEDRNLKIKELAKTGLYTKKEIGLLTNCSERTVYRVLNQK